MKLQYGHDDGPETYVVGLRKGKYFELLEALDYIANYDVERSPDHAAHLSSVAKKALGR